MSSIRLTTLRQQRWLASLLVVALALRALIPVGFMPSGDGKVALQICPEGFPAALLHHAGHHHDEGHDASQSSGHDHHDADGAPLASGHEHHDSGGTSPVLGHDHAQGHDHKSWMQGHCPFGAAAGAPGACNSSLLVTIDVGSAPPLPDTAIVAAVFDFRFFVAQPRAPPTHLV